MARLPDRVEIQAVDGSGTLDAFTSLSISSDLTQPSEGAFEIGDDGTWQKIEDFVKPGFEWRVLVNGLPRLQGRIEADDIPIDSGAGSVVRLTVRTKLADAMYAAADPGISIRDTTIKQFILNLYEPLGFTEADFYFTPYSSRDLFTGLESNGKGAPQRVDLEPIKEKEARVQPNETVFQAADRLLRRHGFMHWDSPDGRIVVAYPNDTQDPTYFLQYSRNKNTQLNNVLTAKRTIDYSGIPSAIMLFGKTKKGKAVAAFTSDEDLIEAGFYRPTAILASGVTTDDRAQRAVARELSARSRNKDSWEISVDGLSFWDGHASIPWTTDATCSVETDVAGGPLGAYYIHRVNMTRDASGGDTTTFTALKRGIWRL